MEEALIQRCAEPEAGGAVLAPLISALESCKDRDLSKTQPTRRWWSHRICTEPQSLFQHICCRPKANLDGCSSALLSQEITKTPAPEEQRSPSHCAILPRGFSEMDLNTASLEQTLMRSRDLHSGQTSTGPRQRKPCPLSSLLHLKVRTAMVPRASILPLRTA